MTDWLDEVEGRAYHFYTQGIVSIADHKQVRQDHFHLIRVVRRLRAWLKLVEKEGETCMPINPCDVKIGDGK